MEFDKSRVYTALNADELKVGSRVIVADDITHLKWFVRDVQIHTLEEIGGENYCHRFMADDGDAYALAYLVEEPEDEEPEEDKLEWFELRIGDVITRDDTIALVTQIDEGCNRRSHIRAGDMWIPDTILEEWKKVEK